MSIHQKLIKEFEESKIVKKVEKNKNSGEDFWKEITERIQNQPKTTKFNRYQLDLIKKRDARKPAESSASIQRREILEREKR